MEKKKLLLVAISVGVFLVLTIGAAILVFTPKNTNLPFETVTSNTNPGTITIIPPASYQATVIGSDQQPSSIDAVDLVRNPEGVPGLVAPENTGSQAYGTGTGAETVIRVTQPSTVAVPTTPPAGRAANQPAPPASTPAAASRPAQTTTTPAQTTTTPAQTATSGSQTASRPAQTTTTPAQTTATNSQTASRPAQTTTTPAQTATSTSQTASRPAQTTTTPQTTTAVAVSASQATQARLYNDYWVQTGAFSTMASAEGVQETLESKGITSIIENGNIDGRILFRVRVGPYTTQKEAHYWLALIKSIDGFEDSQVRQTESLR